MANGEQGGDEVRLEDVGLTYRFGRSLIGGVDRAALEASAGAAEAAAVAFAEQVAAGRAAGMTEAVQWAQLDEPAANRASLDAALAWGAEARTADIVLSVGIGGSYLGNRVLRDALLGPGWNGLPREARGDAAELWFAGFHLDPHEARHLVRAIRARGDGVRVRLLAISKSGTTTETLATTLAVREALLDGGGVDLRLAALTAPTSRLAALARSVEGDVLPFPEGIGGRFSVLSPVGLVTAAASGVDTDALLAGARAARAELLAAGGDLARNPALLYATLHHLHARQGRMGAVFMPYAERLRCVSEWYVQLLAESLGKARSLGGETVHAGRTPIVAVGTTDMHAQTQLHQEGPHDKTVTTLDVVDWGEATPADRVPDVAMAGPLAGKTFAELNTLARESNELALAGDGRPSDALVLDRLDARTLGGLLFTLMATVAYEGELLGVCTYDQPGVEAYKQIMRDRLAGRG